MRSFRSKPLGWRNESYRHYLASKGVSTKRYSANKYFMSLTVPSSNPSSAQTASSHKTLRRDDGDKSPYVEMQVLHGRGVGSAGGKPYEYTYAELFKWANNRTLDVRKKFDSESEAREFIDSLKTYDQASKVMKKLDEEGGD